MSLMKILRGCHWRTKLRVLQMHAVLMKRRKLRDLVVRLCKLVTISICSGQIIYIILLRMQFSLSYFAIT